MNITTLEKAAVLGRILSNYNKIKTLVMLARGPLPKKKIKEMLGLASYGTISEYIEDFINADLVEEYVMMKEGRWVVHMVKLKDPVITINLPDLEEKGWDNVSKSESKNVDAPSTRGFFVEEDRPEN